MLLLFQAILATLLLPHHSHILASGGAHQQRLNYPEMAEIAVRPLDRKPSARFMINLLIVYCVKTLEASIGASQHCQVDTSLYEGPDRQTNANSLQISIFLTIVSLATSYEARCALFSTTLTRSATTRRNMRGQRK